MLLQRKPRCDSKLDGLSPERQEELIDWLGDENVGLAEAVARVRERWGVVVGLSAMQAYRRRQVELRRYAEEAEAAAEWTMGAPARFAEAVVRRAQQMAFAALTDVQPDVAEAERLGRLAARLQRVELARERVAQAERRLAWAERGWAREAEVQDVEDEVRMKEVEEQIAQKEAEWAQEREAQEAELDAEWEEVERQQKALSDKLKAEEAVSGKLKAVSEELAALREHARVKQGEKGLEQETSREGTEGKEAISDQRSAVSFQGAASGEQSAAVSGKIDAVRAGPRAESGGVGANGEKVETEEEANARRDRVCDEIARRRAAGLSTVGVGMSNWDEPEVVGSMW